MKKAIWIMAGLLAAGISEAKDKFTQEVRGALAGSAFYSHLANIRGADEIYLGYDSSGRLASAVALGRIRSSARVTAMVRVRRHEAGYAIEEVEILDADKIKDGARRRSLQDMAVTLQGALIQDGSGKELPLDAISGATASRKNTYEDFKALAKAAAAALAANPSRPKVPLIP